MARSALLTVMTQAAMRAGRSLSRDFGEVQNLQVSIKGPAEFVEKSRQEAAKIIRQELMKARPEFGAVIDGREIAGAEKQNRWLIASMQGETNFLHGQPRFCISIALEREGKIIAGVLFNPATDELYSAEKGRGAFLNDRRLRCASRKELATCMVSGTAPDLKDGGQGRYLKQFASVMKQVAAIRGAGCIALELAQVASGSLDGCWRDDVTNQEVAAASILIKEAGATLTDFGGKFDITDITQVVAANLDIQPKLRQLVQQANG